MRRTTTALLLMAALLLMLPVAGCDTGPDEATEVPAAIEEAVGEEGLPIEGADDAMVEHPEVAWHEGDAESAFALAEAEGRPVFLYWGAVWCPPCHYLKAKVFHEPEFVAKSEDFVMVELDGDSERAQILGEQYDVKGYPTVIVFDPSGVEVTRMSSGIPVDRYASVLDVATTQLQPVDEILARVLEVGPAASPPEDLELLAFYSWGQDSRVEMADEDELPTFQRLYAETPADQLVVRSRFLCDYLNAEISRMRSADDENPYEALPEEERAALTEAIRIVLTNPDQRAANLSFVMYWSRETAELLFTEPGPERDALVGQWNAVARALEDDTTLTADDRLSVIYPQLELARLKHDDAAAVAEAAEAEEGAEGTEAEEGEAAEAEEGEEAAETEEGAEATEAEEAEAEEVEEAVEPAVDEPDPKLPPELVEHVRERVAWAGEVVTDEGELQAVMSTMVWLLEEVGLDAQAEQLLTERMGDTIAPYYFMSWYASKKKDAGQTDEAIEWYRKAYDNAVGRYTRFRWGSTYLRSLVDLAPDDVERIEADSTEILTELMTHDDAFMLGNHSRLGQLESKLEGWNEDGAHEDVVGRLRDLVHAECARYPDGEEDSQQARCLSFLVPEEEGEDE